MFHNSFGKKWSNQIDVYSNYTSQKVKSICIWSIHRRFNFIIRGSSFFSLSCKDKATYFIKIWHLLSWHKPLKHCFIKDLCNAKKTFAQCRYQCKGFSPQFGADYFFVLHGRKSLYLELYFNFASKTKYKTKYLKKIIIIFSSQGIFFPICSLATLPITRQ